MEETKWEVRVVVGERRIREGLWVNDSNNVVH
jgi:hypothetical protein